MILHPSPMKHGDALMHYNMNICGVTIKQTIQPKSMLYDYTQHQLKRKKFEYINIKKKLNYIKYFKLLKQEIRGNLQVVSNILTYEKIKD